ncbi:MAG: hypothetical protein DDT40_00798 [candidate division WS2 bacterium]|nr:hypothetical protein [Candidatus Psychracetigena formicireducens]
MPRTFLTLLTFLILFFSLFPNSATAQLVPCGPGTAKENCELCDFFVLFDNIVKFVLQKLVPPIAALMLVFGGSMFFAAAGDPAKIGKARGLLTSVALGLVIIYGAYLLISSFFLIIGVNEWTGLQNWFEYPCP